MNDQLRQPLTALTAGSILPVHDGQGRAVVVFEGQVWITLEDDPRDIVLVAGESFGIDRQGLTLVQACRDSKLILAQGDAATPAPPTALNAVELQQWARTQRSLVIADALSSALAALHNAAARVLARAFAAPGSRRPGFI